ncbi:MAG TPA: carboxypeptidase-like regulatory domain-containing protein [Acidobacteriaceae bacterium]|nr:carboxypeptidase-like regulatory domain-containing protein [Acidobacteriaceae bacterium]
MRRLLPPLLRPPLAAAFVLFLTGTAALLPTRGQNLSDASGFTVAGSVVNAATGQSIARAEVILDNDRAQLTAGDGTFSFDRVPSGTISLSIRKPGYLGFGGAGMGGRGFAGGGLHNAGSGAPSGPPRLIVVGPQMPSLTFQLTPLAAITGHLILSTADPADHIRITLFRRAFQNGRSRWSIAAATRSRSDGSWRVANLAPGRYMVLASASVQGPNDPENSQVPVFGFPALYYPGVTDIGSAGVLILKPGQQAQADMTLVRQRFFPVTIVVRGMPDTPTSFEIMDAGGRPTELPVHFDLRSQTAHANVPGGSWILIARAFGATMRFGNADFQVAGAPVSVAVAVGPVPPIPVTFHRDFTASADGSQPPAAGPGVNLFLVSADDFSTFGFGGGLSSDNNQDWEINVSSPGRYWVQAQPFPPAYISSITTGGTDLATTPLTVIPGSPPSPIEITLRNDGGTIAGKVDSSSSGAAGGAGEQPQVWIYAIPLFPTTGELPEARLQENSQFSFANLPPGSYRVVACDASQEIDFHSPEGLAAWSGKGQVVSVDPNGTANAELTVIHGDFSE